MTAVKCSSQPGPGHEASLKAMAVPASARWHTCSWKKSLGLGPLQWGLPHSTQASQGSTADYLGSAQGNQIQDFVHGGGRASISCPLAVGHRTRCSKLVQQLRILESTEKVVLECVKPWLKSFKYCHSNQAFTFKRKAILWLEKFLNFFIISFYIVSDQIYLFSFRHVVFHMFIFQIFSKLFLSVVLLVLCLFSVIKLSVVHKCNFCLSLSCSSRNSV